MFNAKSFVQINTDKMSLVTLTEVCTWLDHLDPRSKVNLNRTWILQRYFNQEENEAMHLTNGYELSAQLISQLLEYLNKHFQKIEAMPFICNKYASNHICLVAFLGSRACFLAYLCTWWRLLSCGMNCYDCTLGISWHKA